MANNRDKLAEELIRLRLIYEPYEARDKEICAELKRLAAEDGNFEVVVKGKGRIKVSAPREKVCKGTAPEIIVDRFLALPQREQARLIDKGLVRIAEQWSGAYYGAVTVELY